MSTTKPTSGYIHGSNLILGMKKEEIFNPLGYSKTCSIQNKAETKDRATKNKANDGKWKGKGVTSLSVSISAEGFCCYDENFGYDELLELWESGQSIMLQYCHRGEETKKVREGLFVITSLEEQAPADDDATYSVSFENDGPVTSRTITPAV